MDTSIPVFIASPIDVKKEREASSKAIIEVSKRLFSVFGTGLHVVQWEDFAPLTPHARGRTAQDEINERVPRSGIFLGILFSRYGSPISEDDRTSGTESEFNLALKYRERIKILTYFREDSAARQKLPDVSQDQLDKLDALKGRLQIENIRYWRYRKVRDFKNRIQLDLFEASLSFLTKASKRQELQTFFPFGIGTGDFSHSVSIIYPVVRTDNIDRTNYDWHRRLMPHVVYDDMQTIRILETALRFIGIEEISIVGSDETAVSVSKGHRVWVCLPRNLDVRERLLKQIPSTRFRFLNIKKIPRVIEWTRKDGSTVNIASPLPYYLKKQRLNIGKGEWHNEYRNVYVRDYGVLARFRSTRDRHPSDPPLYDYFLGGIHGIGSWGAAWYVMERPDKIRRLIEDSNSEDIQILLQVEYHDGMICEVKDISNRTQEEFNAQLLLDQIEKNIPRRF